MLALDNGATTHKLVNIPLADLAEWDAKHDVTGKIVEVDSVHESGSDTKKDQGVIHQTVVT